MGQAAPFSLGLALAQPQKRIVLFTGDGDILMSLGMLTTIANLAPANLCVVVLDNEVYGETGGQPTATAGCTDLVSMARGAGFSSASEVSRESELQELRDIIRNRNALHFSNVKVLSEALPLVFPFSFDGVTSINRFRDAAVA
jgi:thiamine pyrophosphate-dependent acetolactate synthase large subunit-like protein